MIYLAVMISLVVLATIAWLRIDLSFERRISRAKDDHIAVAWNVVREHGRMLADATERIRELEEELDDWRDDGDEWKRLLDR